MNCVPAPRMLDTLHRQRQNSVAQNGGSTKCNCECKDQFALQMRSCTGNHRLDREKDKAKRTNTFHHVQRQITYKLRIHDFSHRPQQLRTLARFRGPTPPCWPPTTRLLHACKRPGKLEEHCTVRYGCLCSALYLRLPAYAVAFALQRSLPCT